MDHATHSTFSYSSNKIFLGNFLVMFSNTLAFDVIGNRLPATEFLVGMIFITAFCQVYLYGRWIWDISHILKIKIFQVKSMKVEDQEEKQSLNPESAIN
jgi:hypothetical protein